MRTQSLLATSSCLAGPPACPLMHTHIFWCCAATGAATSSPCTDPADLLPQISKATPTYTYRLLNPCCCCYSHCIAIFHLSLSVSVRVVDAAHLPCCKCTFKQPPLLSEQHLLGQGAICSRGPCVVEKSSLKDMAHRCQEKMCRCNAACHPAMRRLCYR